LAFAGADTFVAERGHRRGGYSAVIGAMRAALEG
jgi:hypothetical protein